LLYGNTDYVRKHPVATKRVLRAVLKGADLCAAQPERVDRQLVDDGLTESYDRILYALRLHEAGLILSTPQKIIADGTDWRFLSELKRELKA